MSKLTVQGWTSAQQGRNQILRGEITELDKQIAEITGLESQRERLLARMQVITQLQRSRPEVVHLFDELVNAIPEGVNLTRGRAAGRPQSSCAAPRNRARASRLSCATSTAPSGCATRASTCVETVTSGVDRNSQFKVFAQQVSQANTPEGAAEGAAQ